MENNQNAVAEAIFEKYKRVCVKKLHLVGDNKEITTLFSDSSLVIDEKYSSTVIKENSKFLDEDDKFLLQVNFAFSLLDKQEKEILINDFIYNSDKLWWSGKYSRSTYYRNRNNSISKFLYYFGSKHSD